MERLAWRATAGKFDPEGFDPELLHEAFENGIKDLKTIYEIHEKKCERLESVCKEEEKKHWMRVAELQERCKDSATSFQELDSSLDTVAARVVYLGDQLEGVNLPRSRAVEAQKLMRSFADFVSPGPIKSPLMTEPSQLYEEADVISKLYLISQELPPLAKFDRAKEKINMKYDQIERELIEEFVAAQSRSDPDRNKMKEIASIMSHFKGYSQCIDAFIEQSQSGIFLTPSLFNDIIPICLKSQSLVQEVFSNPDQVMSKFVLNIYHGKIQEFVQSKLNHYQEKAIPQDMDKYLTELQDLYSKTIKLSQQLAESNILGIEINFLNKLTRVIFTRYLDTYIETETKSLKEKCSLILTRYYESKNHTKKNVSTGGLYDLTRDIQAKIGRANINIANINITVSGGNESVSSETFLSEEVAINILQETKLALIRCHLLSKGIELPKNVLDILELQLHYLINEHIDYAIELGFQSLPSSEPKTVPEIHFFEIVRQSNAVCHLLEKQFVDSVLPVVVSTPKHGECLKKKKESFENIESKLNNGLDKAINSIIGWVKSLLTKEQKKTDYFPESDDVDMTQTSVCFFIFDIFVFHIFFIFYLLFFFHIFIYCLFQLCL